MKFKNLILICLGLLLIITGCSKENQNPVKPAENESDMEILEFSIDEDVVNQNLVGLWTMEFNHESLALSFKDNREAQTHWIVTSLLPQPAFEIISYDPISGILSVNTTIKNTSSLTAYDVRLIVFSDDSGTRLTNGDDWTALFDIPGGSQINPFKAYAKSEENREFTGFSTVHTQQLQLYFPSNITMIDFAITASWPDNCDEPYQVKDFWHNELYDSIGHATEAEISVYDWQDDVDLVLLSCPAVTGVQIVSFTKQTQKRWILELRNDAGASPGNYMGYIVATSSNSGATALYDIVNIVIKKTPIVEGNAITWGGESFDAGYSLVLDENANMYVAGIFEYTCDFDPGIWKETRTSRGSVDAYIVKYDQQWNLQWVQSWGNEYEDYINNIAIDSAGNIYAVGDFAGIVDFNPGPGMDIHTSGNGTNRHIFLVKYSQNGVFQWARTWGGFSGEYQAGDDLLVNDADKIYVTGMFAGTCDFDPGSHNDIKASTGNTYDAFLSRFTSDGEYEWSAIWGGSGHEYCVAITDDELGNLLLAGIFSGSCDFDPGPETTEKTPVGYYDAYVLKLNSSSNFRWVQSFGGDDLEFPQDIVSDSLSNIFMTGYFLDTTNLDPGPSTDYRTSNGDTDVFLSKFNSTGEYQWGQTWGGSDAYGDYGFSLTMDDSENVNVTGRFAGTVDFDPSPGGSDVYTEDWFTDIYLCAYDTDGNYQWVNTWGGIYYDAGTKVEFFDGKFYLTGYFGQTCDFDPGTGLDIYTAEGYLDAFLLRYSR